MYVWHGRTGPTATTTATAWHGAEEASRYKLVPECAQPCFVLSDRSAFASPLSSHCPATRRRRPSWAVSRFSSRARVTLPPPLSLSLPLYSRVCISFSVAIAKPEPTAVRSEALPCQLATWPVGDGQAVASTRPVATDAVKGLGS